MQKESFQSGQKVLKQDLALAQSSKEQALEDRLTDNFVPGIANDLLNGMAFLPGATATSITVRTGIGYNSNGERILIGNEAVPYNDSNPNNTTSDGIGGNTSTPQSSGSANIPLTTTSVNLVYIQYLATTDPNVFTLHKVTSQKLFTRVDDGYEIKIVNAGNVDPSTININASAPGTGGPWTFLGLVDFRVGSSVSPSMFDLSKRPAFSISTNRVLGTTPKADFSNVTPAGNYGANTVVNFDQHVKAIGSTAPTAKNPHGLTLNDIGFSGKTVGQHEQYLHSSGIANGDQTANVGTSLNLKVNPRCPDLDEVVIYGLTSIQFLVVQDITLASTDLGTKTFSFVGLSTGTYYFWANSTTRALEFGTTAPTLSELNKFLLWTVNFSTTKGASTISSDHFLVPPSGPCSGTSNFTNLIDGRFFGNLAGNNLQRDGQTDTVSVAHNLTLTSKNLTVTSGTIAVRPGSVSVVPSSFGASAVIVKDAATGLVNKTVLTEQGVTFPDGSTQVVAATTPTSQSVVTGSRSTGTVYQNTSTKPLYVSVSLDVNASQDGTAFVDTSPTPTTVVVRVGAPGGSNAGFQLFFIVLPSYYYKVTNTGSLFNWTEWV